MPRILVVNNYPARERFARLETAVREHEVEVAAMDWTEVGPSKFAAFDGVVLSGSPYMLSEPRTVERFASEIEAVKDGGVPVLGVCFGHQLVASAFGAKVVKDGKPVLKMVETRVLAADPLFNGLPESLNLLESRHEVVESLPKEFLLLARSETSPIAAMRHDRRPLYGVQFHPERYTRKNPAGREVLGNFLRMAG